jgi:APA family basic amino acid/polyamine antiporter
MSENLKKKLGLFDATSIVAGSMIGSGIFIVTSPMAKNIGASGWILLLWLLTGLITVLAALSYGELAGMMPSAGGQYVYIRRAYGKFMAFLYGWSVFTVIQTGVIAAVGVAFAKYTAVFFPELNNVCIHFFDSLSISYAQLLAIASIGLLTWMNSRGIQNGRWIQLIFTAAKIMALLALIVLGLAIGLKTDVFWENMQNMWQAKATTIGSDGKILQEQLTGLALLGVLGTVIIHPLFSSDAWNNVTFIASEIKEPKKNIPRSLILGTLIVTIVYLLANVAYLALLPLHGDPNGHTVMEQGIMFANEERVGAAAASVIFGDVGLVIMAILIMVSTFGCNNGLILSGSRLFYAMAKDGLFFDRAKELNRFEVPGKALWIQFFWASLLCLSGKYGDLIEYCTFVSLLFYIITIGGIFILRRKEPDTERPYKAWGYPFIPACYIVITLAICVALLIYSTTTAGLGLLIVSLGIPVYFIVNRHEK